MVRSLYSWLFALCNMRVVRWNKRFILARTRGTCHYSFYFIGRFGIPYKFAECNDKNRAKFKWRILMNQED